MTKEIKNIEASVKNKLINISKQEKKAFSVILMLYIQERLLYRLSISEYSESFILKGGLLLFGINEFKGRPTRDIDFLAKQIKNDANTIKSIFNKVCGIQCNDGIFFDRESIKAEKTGEDRDYNGIEIKLNAFLGKAKEIIKLDIGFGDVVVPKALDMAYPTLLNTERPIIKVYSIESVIAEKFEAMIKLAELNSRMKDFYDIYDLMQKRKLESGKLREAVFQTFERRHTYLNKDHIIFNQKFFLDLDRSKRWKDFLKKTGRENTEFSEIMILLKKFLNPIYESIVYEKEFFAYWDNELLEWNYTLE